MKKINLFNKTISPLSDGKGCPVERGGVWELPRRTPCATPSWKEGERKVPSFRGTGPHKNVQHFCGWFHAESPRCCRELVCGKTDGIPLFSGMTVRICGMMIAIAALFATPSFAEPTELDKKTVASKAYVDTKQDKITTGLVEFDGHPELMLPAVTTYDSTSGLVANKIGILDETSACDAYSSTSTCLVDMGDWNGFVGTEMDSFVPTVRAVANSIKRLYWDSTQDTKAINAYNTTFGNGTYSWAGSWADLINGEFLANSLALKQNKLPAKSTGNAAPKRNQAVVLNTAGNPSNVYTTAGKDLALTAKSGAQKVMNYIDGTTASATFATSQGLTEAGVKSALVSLELLKDVYGELNAKITNNALPTGTTGTVVTYNGVNAETGVQEFTETAMTGTVTYTNGTLDNANNIATITAVGTRQKKKECGGYEPAAAGQPAHDGTHPGDEDYCWLWIFPED